MGTKLYVGNLNYNTNRLKVVSEYRDISPTFSFLDSAI